MSFMKINLSPTFGARFVQRLLVKKKKILLSFTFFANTLVRKKKFPPCAMLLKVYFIWLRIVNMLGMNCYMFKKHGEIVLI